MNVMKASKATRHSAMSFCLALFGLLLAMSSSAEESTQAFQMMAIEDFAQGRLITDGKFEIAIQRLEKTEFSRNKFEAANNLCVAYTKARLLDKAAESCEAAVSVRDVSGVADYRVLSIRARKIMRDRAIALSNRGVLRAVKGDRDGARADFRESIEIAGFLPEPQANLDYLAELDSLQKATAQHTR